MPLPRNTRAKNSNLHKRSNTSGRELAKKTTELENICEKHKVGNLTFRSCKFADAEGNVTLVEHEQVRGNMKSGIMIIKANNVMSSNNGSVYDLIDIANNKKIRDLKKKEEEFERAKAEMARLQAAANPSSLPVDDEHSALLEKMIEESATQLEENAELNTFNVDNDTALELMENIGLKIDINQTEENNNSDMKRQPEETIGVSEETLAIETPHEENKDSENKDPENKDPEKSPEPLSSRQRKKLGKMKKAEDRRDKAKQQFHEQLFQKSMEKQGNKYFRNFMKDIRSKFTLVERPEYKFFEAKVDSSNMIIDGVKTYQLTMPANTQETYLLLLGDLQMKSGLIRQIDPAYQSEDVLKEQYDFLEKIKAREDAKTFESNANILDDEFDELDELGISSDEIDSDNVPDLVSV